MVMPEKKAYSYRDIADTPQHGEIIESSYLLGEKTPKSIWQRVLEVVILVVTVGVCAYLMVFLFHNGNHRSAARSASHPAPPVGASTSAAPHSSDASCQSHPACADLAGDCCPTKAGDMLSCCSD